MLLDRPLRTTLRNFSTFFLIVALVTIPVNVAWGFFFQDVIATQEVHAAIEALPSGDRVRGVDEEAIDRARYARFIALALQLALLPLMLRAARRAIERDQAGHIPTALGSWRFAATGARASSTSSRLSGVALAMTGFAVVVWVLTSLIGRLLAAPVADSIAWLIVGLLQGAALALALPFVLVGLVEARAPAPAAPS
ncbi:MAG: hypothetical protein ACRDK3_06485 [Actinomycetota bacterium]